MTMKTNKSDINWLKSSDRKIDDSVQGGWDEDGGYADGGSDNEDNEDNYK